MKIIYLEEKEVKMGDKVSLNGAVVTVTQQLIDDLPNLFKVQDEAPEYVECIEDAGSIDKTVDIGEIVKSTYKISEAFPYRFYTKNGENGYGNSETFYKHFKPSTKEAWLLQEAKRRYPKGTKFTLSDNEIFTSNSNFEYNDSWGGHGDVRQTIQCTVEEEGTLDSSVWDSVLGWAEVVKPLFTTENGVDVYDDEKSCAIRKSDFSIVGIECFNGKNTKEWLYFSTREAAEEYIAKHKEKTLEDYENELLCRDKVFTKGRRDIYTDDFYSILKKYEPKAYYSIVLQLIADYLNEERIKLKYTIILSGNNYRVQDWVFTTLDSVTFSSLKVATKAIKIMGDKLDFIYKH